MDPGVQRPARDEVDGPTQDSREFVAEILDRPSETSSRRECVEQINVTVGPTRAPGLGAEDVQTP